MAEDVDALRRRLQEINQEISAILPEFQASGGSAAKARLDARIFAERLEPLFNEHHAIAMKLKALTD